MEKRQVVVVVVVVLVRVGRIENRSGDLRVDDHDGWAVRVSLVREERVVLLLLLLVGRTRRGRTPPVFQADTPTRRRIPNVVIVLVVVIVVVCETVRTNHPKKNQRQQDRKVNQGIRRIVSAFVVLCCFRFVSWVDGRKE